MGGAGQARVARIIRETRTSLGSGWAATGSACRTVGATGTTDWPRKVVVRIHLDRLGAGLRGRADLARGAIDTDLALIAAPLVDRAYQGRRAVSAECALGFAGDLTDLGLVGGNDATLSSGTVLRCTAAVAAGAHVAHLGSLAVAVELARIAVRPAATGRHPG